MRRLYDFCVWETFSSFCWNGCCTLLESNNSSAPARSFHLSELLTEFPASRQPVWVSLCSHQCESPARRLTVTPNHTPLLSWYRRHWFWSAPPPQYMHFVNLLSFLGQTLNRRCECLKNCPKCCCDSSWPKKTVLLPAVVSYLCCRKFHYISECNIVWNHILV